MTYSEALQWLENKRAMMKHNRYAFMTIDVESNDRAIQAIRKQIYRKPELAKITPYGEYAKCHCGCVLIDEYHFCPNCGQAIKWGDE